MYHPLKKYFHILIKKQIILFIFGSGPVKGFAVTLSIGLITTLFSAYFISRHLTSIIVLKNKEKKLLI